MNSFFDYSMLLTYSGTTLAVTLVTQFLKGMRAIDRLPTRAVSYITALVLMLCTRLVSGVLDWREYLLVPVNAVVVALAANGAHDAISDR